MNKSLKIKIVTIVSIFVCLNANAWDWPFSNSSKIGTIEDAQQRFIKEAQYMSEKEALANEISYYKKPRITVKKKVRELTGKAAIHECNLLLKENQKTSEAVQEGRISIGRVWLDVDKVKNYAVNHPNGIVGAEYYFEGVFTHYNRGYSTERAKVLCLNGNWYIVRIYR